MVFISFASLAAAASSLATSTLILTGFVSALPLLYLANFYLHCKRYQLAKWSPKGKVVVITGASSGIGEALAYEFARQGATLILCARRVDRLSSVGNVCKDLGAEDVLISKADVSRESDIDRLIGTIEAKYEKIDCLVLNAGVSMGEPLGNLEDFSVIRDIMDVNYFGSTLFTYNSLPLLQKAKEPAHIVVVSSLAAVIPSIPLRTGYTASKYALKGFFESLQAEVYDQNIFITIAYPGAVKTEINKNRLGKDHKDLDLSDAISAETCAKTILDGTIKGQKEIIFTNVGKLGRIMEGVFPDLLFYLSYIRSRGYVSVSHNEEKKEH